MSKSCWKVTSLPETTTDFATGLCPSIHPRCRGPCPGRVCKDLGVGEGFLAKLRATLADALKQLDAADPECLARRMIFTMLHFDDWVGDYQPQYIAQVEAHLLQHPVDGAKVDRRAQLVFCLGSNLFERSFMMKSATILSRLLAREPKRASNHK